MLQTKLKFNELHNPVISMLAYQKKLHTLFFQKTPAGPTMHLFCWLFALLLNSWGGQRILDEVRYKKPLQFFSY